ncbi:MAG TPA: L-threonylcarbamoyladenylate synthase [Candidatus Limnocylindria bacterium]|nr:L-threonylcarbamoyladenylate synthase [Candidatus Limnocylindria bacterium]
MLIFYDLQDEKLISLLKDGAVGVVPSDTLYGLMCQAGNQEAVERLYKLKSRKHKPGTLIAASIDQLVELGIPRRYLTAVEQYWPNSLSVVIPTSPALAYLDRGLMSLPMRVPADKNLQQFLEKTGPLQTTSANAPGEPTANTVAEAQAYFGDSVDFYVDGGDLSGNAPSTIIRIVDDAVEVLREGAVKINEKGEVEQ